MPSAAPTTILAQTSATQIYVQYTAPSNSGSPILSYEVQMDDGQGGDFVSLIGVNPYYLKLWYVVTSNITKGTIYRFRYRALNAIGWGQFSDTAFL